MGISLTNGNKNGPRLWQSPAAARSHQTDPESAPNLFVTSVPFVVNPFKSPSIASNSVHPRPVYLVSRMMKSSFSCQTSMKRKVLFTLLWMLVFTAITFVVGVCILVPLVYSRQHTELVRYVDAVGRSVFFVSPLVALWLGWRGKLPGTKRRRETDAA